MSVNNIMLMRVWSNGRTSASQADDEGSIPFTRSILNQQVKCVYVYVDALPSIIGFSSAV